VEGCGHTIETKLRADQVGTKYARVTGYMQTSALSAGGTAEETPAPIRHDVILDEASLVKITGETCVESIVRTASVYGEPLAQLSPTFVLDGEEVRGVVESEVVSVYDYGFTGTREVVGVEGVAPDRFLSLSVTAPEEKVFRVVERKARLRRTRQRARGAAQPRASSSILRGSSAATWAAIPTSSTSCGASSDG